MISYGTCETEMGSHSSGFKDVYVWKFLEVPEKHWGSRCYSRDGRPGYESKDWKLQD